MSAIHKDEMDLVLENGIGALIKPFERAGVTDVLDLGRKSSVKEDFSPD